MNKVITIAYSLVGGLVVALTTYISLVFNAEGTTIVNFLLFFPMLTISFFMVWLVNNKIQKVSISDIIVPASINTSISIILPYLPLFISVLSEQPLYSSNILLYVFTYVYVVVILVSKKIPNKKAVKYMRIGGCVVYMYCVIGTVINCFVKVIEYTAG